MRLNSKLNATKYNEHNSNIVAFDLKYNVCETHCRNYTIKCVNYQ